MANTTPTRCASRTRATHEMGWRSLVLIVLLLENATLSPVVKDRLVPRERWRCRHRFGVQIETASRIHRVLVPADGINTRGRCLAAGTQKQRPDVVHFGVDLFQSVGYQLHFSLEVIQSVHLCAS